MPRAAKSTSKTATKKPSTRKPKAPPPATAVRAGPGYTIRVSVAGLQVNGNEMPGQVAADAIAALLEQSFRKAVKA